MKNGAELLIETLENLGVDTVFGYPGGAVLPLYDAVYHAKKLNHILVRHEQGAVHAAEGYAKSTDKVGVVIVTSGPGATNAITGIADAFSDSVPLVVFTGQVGTPGIGKDAFQEADMIGITMPITKYNYQVRNIEDLPHIIKEAFHIASTGRKGPVVIDLPKDMTVMETVQPAEREIDIPSYQPTIEPNQLQVSKLVKAIEAAKKPLILGGNGIVLAGADKEFVEFVDKLQIPTVTTLLGLGIIDVANPNFLGMVGMHGSYAANIAITECDLLINIGCRFADRVAGAPNDFAKNATIAHIDIDPAEIGKIIETQIPIVADCKKVLEALLKAKIKEPDISRWRKLCAQHKNMHPYTYEVEKTGELIKPQHVIELVGKYTNGDAIVVTDVGQHQMWSAQFYPFKHNRQLITSGGLGTMGFGVPAAIGAKIANPDKEVVLFVGDGGFQMTNQELALCRQYDIDIKILLLNNGVLGMVRQWQTRFFEERYSQTTFNNEVDFQILAEAYGIDHVRIDNADTLAQELEEHLSNHHAVLIEVIVDPDEHVLPMVPAGKANYQMIGVGNA
ncbi:MAG: biosynthetic-type acetolactate synthase large subunit [Lactobacillales bacterium]|nr:biosynthetic-type acetolactate synthase large subunit [Lactobacillales bacterium]